MRVITCVLLLVVCAMSARAETPYWVEPMRQVHDSYTGSGGTIARFGDSITVSLAFFKPMMGTQTNTSAQDNAALGWLRDYMQQACWYWYDDGYYYQNGANGGTTTAWPLQYDVHPPDQNIDYWLSNLNPEMTVIMWGTNDCHAGTTVPTYKDRLRTVVQRCKSNGTVPVISTIPPRRGYDALTAQYAGAVRELALEEEIPLIDYNDEILTRRPGGTWDGTLISGDGVHPSNTAPASDFSETMLSTNGYTLRNWVTLHKLYEVWENVVRPFAVVYDVAYLGNDTYGYTIAIDGHDGLLASYFANMTFEGINGGQVQQMQAFVVVDVDSDEDAGDYHGLGDPPYDMYRDSYFFEPFPSNTAGAGIVEGVNSYHIEAGTGPGSEYEDMELAYIVVNTGGDLHYDGVISRQAVNYDVDGFLTAPVPGDATLDDVVDGADYTVWADHYNYSGMSWEEGNFNGDAIVDGADYTIWADHYTGGKGPVPEPLTLALLAVGSGLALLRRRRIACKGL